MESGEQKLHNAARPTEPVYQMRYGAKQQTVFQMFHVKQDFFYRTLLHGCNLPLHVLE